MGKEETIDCVRVSLYLDTLRRKATSHEEVKCIDWIFEHFRERPGRFHHDEPDTMLTTDGLTPAGSAKLAANTSANMPANTETANTPPANKPDRKAYMRELMRRKRAKT